MTRTVRKNLLACVFTLLAAAVFSFDFGIDLSNLAGGQYQGEWAWYTDHKSTAWVTVPFDASGNTQLSVEGSLYAAKPAASDAYTWFADLDLFRLKFTPVDGQTAKVSMSVGRIPQSDVTGFVLAQNIDGVELHGVFGFGNLDFAAGYTGLLNTRKGGALMTDDDQADMTENADEPYGLGSKRVIGKLTLQIPQAIGSMDVLLEGTGEYDLRRYLESDYNSLADMVYGTVSLSTPLNPVAFGTLTGTWQSGIKESDGSKGSSNSLLASARVDLYPSSKNQLFGQFLFSPRQSDFFDVFSPISFQSLGTLYSRNFQNLMRASAGWNFNPTAVFNLDFGGKVFMVAQTDDAYPDFYNGSELNAGATLKATSDLKFRLDSYFWVPSEGDFEMQASLKAVFSF